MGIEVTAAFIPLPSENRFSLETPIRVLTLAKSAGCRFTFGTDAHDPEAQQRLPELGRLVQAVGIAAADVLTVGLKVPD